MPAPPPWPPCFPSRTFCLVKKSYLSLKLVGVATPDGALPELVPPPPLLPPAGAVGAVIFPNSVLDGDEIGTGPSISPAAFANAGST